MGFNSAFKGLNEWSLIPLQTMTASHAIKIFPNFRGTHLNTALFIEARHWILS